MHLKVTNNILVYSPPVNEATKKWGVYCIPRMWRALDGKLVVRFNGEEDTLYVDTMQRAENLFFVSDDDGKTWEFCENGAEIYDIKVISGWENPYLKCSDGITRAIRATDKCAPVKNIPLVKEFPSFFERYKMGTYRQCDLPKECFSCELLEYAPDGKLTVKPVNIHFPERELHVNTNANNGSEIVEIEHFIKPHIFCMPYVNSIFELPDGTLGGLAFGQCPHISDRYCAEGYFLVSTDGGENWHLRGVITPNSEELPLGKVGDAGEMSITIAPNGDLLCVVRTDLSINHKEKNIPCGTRLFVSKDMGYTWVDKGEIADSSITPHIKTLKNGTVVCVYGRPGVHLIYSTDNGETWSEPVSIIGKTLKEEMAAGRDYMDCKYFNTESYSNHFVEVLEDDTVLILYNNQKYLDTDGLNHKAAFIAVVKCE